jgi:enoyl-CoA hydratase/carnithine racemase
MPTTKKSSTRNNAAVRLITLNRPEAMNAISRSMIKEIHQALDDVEQDPKCAPSS